MYPTNHIHMGYMDVQAWKNMMHSRSTSNSVQPRMTTLKCGPPASIWPIRKTTGTEGPRASMSIQRRTTTTRHIGDEIDFAWTHMFMDGKLSFQAVYGHMFAGAYIRRTWEPTSIKTGRISSSG